MGCLLVARVSYEKLPAPDTKLSYILIAFKELCCLQVGDTERSFRKSGARVSYDTIITNRYPWQKKALHGLNYPKPISIAAGEKLGTFNMGSSVILLTEKTIPNVRTLDVGQMISYGERLLDV